MELVAKTDVGKKRKNNEDSYYMKVIDENNALFIVADGLGGHSYGEIASSMLTQKISEYIEAKARWLKNATDEKIIYVLKEAINFANLDIFEFSKSSAEYEGMGTTVTLVYRVGKKVFFSSIGDSRLYHIDENLNKITLLTDDDTYVNELLRKNVIDEEEAKNHPQRHMLTKAIGIGSKLEFEVNRINIERGYLLLCTDGMSNMLTENEIIKIFNSTKFDDVASNIVVKANENGGLDNITVIVVKL